MATKKQKIQVPLTIRALVACSNSHGVPVLVPVRYTTTEDDYDAGRHYGAIAVKLADRGYTRHFVVLDEEDLSSTDASYFVGPLLELIDWDGADSLN